MSPARGTLALVLFACGACGGNHPEQTMPARTPSDSDFTAGTGVSIREQRVTVAGAEVFFMEAGQATDPVLLLLHGGRFSSETWRELGSLEHFAQNGYLVIAPDLPGFGRTPSNPLSNEEFLAAFLNARGLAAVALLSPSMSGGFSLPFVASHPERVTAFFPVAPAGVERFADQLRDNSTPTLVLWGSEDRVFDVDGAARLAALFASAQVHIFEGASHPCYLDQPDAFQRVVLGFLNEQSQD